MIIKNLIIPLFQWEQKLKIIFLGNYYNLPDLVIQDTRTKKFTIYKDIAKSNRKDNVFYFPCFTIDNLIYGEYIIYAFNSETKEYSIPINITITGATKSRMLKMAAEFSGYKNNQTIEYFSETLTGDDNYILKILNEYKKAKTKENKFLFAELLQNFVKILNTRIKGFNVNTNLFYLDNDSGILHTSPEANNILKIDIETKQPVTIFCSPSQFEYQFSVCENKLFLYVELNKENLPINLFFSFTPTIEINNQIKEKRIKYLKEYNQTLEVELSYPEHYFNFTDKEKKYILLLSKIQPSPPLLSTPSIELYDRNIIFYFDEEELKLFDKWPQSLQLAYVETELSLSKDYVKHIGIVDREMEFQFTDLDLIDEDYFYWIEDINGHILSNVGIIPCDKNTPIEINENIDPFWIYKYNDHLIPYTINNHNDVSQILTEISAAFLSTANCSIVNYYHKLILETIKQRKIGLIPSMIRTVMEDRIVYNNYRVIFFNNPILTRNKDKTITMPMMGNAMFVFESYTKDNEFVYDIIKSNSLDNIEYEFNNCQYGIIWAFDSFTYTLSGFVLLDYTQIKDAAQFYTFLCEVKRK